MSLFDSHTHLYFDDSFPEPAEAVKRAIETGVEHLVFPGVNAATIEPIRRLHEIFPENTSMAIGLHPTDVVQDTWREELEKIDDELNKRSREYVAIGEIGIDLHWNKETLDLQQQAFDMQCDWAARLGLPAIIHSRDGFEATFEVLKGKEIPVVFHSYSGDIPVTERILADFPLAFFGINGIVTFKNSKLKDVLQVIPDNKLLIETDAPYLAPVPKRGSVNESAFLVHTAQFIAREKSMDFDAFANLTWNNSCDFFGLNNDKH